MSLRDTTSVVGKQSYPVTILPGVILGKIKEKREKRKEKREKRKEK